VKDDLGARLSALGASRYTELVTATTHAVLESKGETEPALRWAVFHRRMEELPASVRAYVDKVTQHAYKVTDADIDSLKSNGFSEDAIFEITGAAAMGAAITRLERGLIALHESTP
jgi:alkylhydroperoxidase family enzyme